MGSLSAVVEEKHLLKHPFYVLWLEGKLPKEALQKYAAQYFQLVDHLPRFISTLHSQCPDEQTRQLLVRNLMEEELGHGNGNVAHTQLWLDFAEELGIPQEDVINAPLLPETTKAIESISAACRCSLVEGAAALYAYESQVPRIAEEKIRWLEEFYGIHSNKALRFFKVHAELDKKHGAIWKILVKKHATTPDLLIRAKESAQQTATILWKMFDGMYDAFVPLEIKKI